MSEQPNNQKLDRAEMSSVWKDGGNERFGLKLDLVRHLLQQREEPQWMRCKKQLIDTLSLEKSTESLVIVDVGCGLGLDSIEMAKELARSPYGGKVIGVDFNSQMINYAKESLSEVSIPANVTVEFQKADLTTLSNFSDGSVDVVRADITLQHVDLDAALKQIARILKPGGRFVSLKAHPEVSTARTNMFRLPIISSCHLSREQAFSYISSSKTTASRLNRCKLSRS
jgi:ubiquinone/menaquinone biosynthesis C-methylase UbiE